MKHVGAFKNKMLVNPSNMNSKKGNKDLNVKDEEKKKKEKIQRYYIKKVNKFLI